MNSDMYLVQMKSLIRLAKCMMYKQSASIFVLTRSLYVRSQLCCEDLSNLTALRLSFFSFTRRSIRDFW